LRLEKKRVSEVLAGKGASKAGRQFARLSFSEASDLFIEERKAQVSERTAQLDRERLKPLGIYLGETPLLRITASDVSTYQRARLSGRVLLKANKKELNGVGNRTINMEVTLLRQIMRRAKVWSVISEDVKMLPEPCAVVGRVLTREQKLHLFRTAAKRPAWDVAYCAAVIAVNTTCRKVELLTLRWADVGLFTRTFSIERSKTDAGHRLIPLNDEAMAAFARLRKRADMLGGGVPEHFVFPACENNNFDFEHHQKTFRTAWRSLVKAAAMGAGDDAAEQALKSGGDPEAARQSAMKPFQGFRFHDLRHQSITEMAEAGIPEAAMQSIAGHLSKKMLDHYSHVRLAAKRQAVEALGGGLIAPEPDAQQAGGKAN
jgi:integrase